jgi:hypothetical protein
MTRAEIEQHHWLERYLAGRLSAADTERFEAYWAAHPEIIDDLEHSARLAQGLRQLDAARQLDTLLRPAWWSGRMRLMALAASVACVALAGAIWRQLGAIDAAPRIASVAGALPGLAGVPLQPLGQVTLMRLRSATDATLVLPQQPAALLMRVMPDVGVVAATTDVAGAVVADEAAARFVVTIEPLASRDSRVSRDTLVLEDALPLGADGFVAFYVDSRALLPGRYAVTLERVDPAARAPAAPGHASTSRFLLRVETSTAAP